VSQKINVNTENVYPGKSAPGIIMTPFIENWVQSVQKLIHWCIAEKHSRYARCSSWRDYLAENTDFLFQKLSTRVSKMWLVVETF
jgi:hypothetical protein